MKRIDTPTALAGGHFSNANPDAGGLPTQLDASWFESVQEEIASVIEKTGKTLNPGNKSQLLEALKSLIDASGSVVPAGTAITFRGQSAPEGYLIEDGRLLYINKCPGLYAAIGNLYNGGVVPINTFRIPDSRGRVDVAAGAGPGLTDRDVGAMLGEEIHLLTEAEIPEHTHAGPDFTYLLRPPHAGSLTGNDTNGAGTEQAVGSGDGGEMLSIGGGEAHNNMQPSLVALKCIKLGPDDDPVEVV